jgi:thymidylate synthase
MTRALQQILVFQQNGSGLHKISGIEEFGRDFCQINIFNIDQALSPILDETDMYLPDTIGGDLVLDFLKHPDLSYDLAKICFEQNIPVVASGQKEKRQGVLTPPT